MKRMRNAFWIVLLLAAVLAASCGGGGDSGPQGPAVVTGVFVDSPVAGIAYRTATQSGTTNAQGQFKYVAGETVTFSIGDLDLPPVTGAGLVNPLSIFDTTDINDTSVVNLARLLQTLDDDGDAGNGIVITSAAHTAATGLTTVDFSNTTTFETQVADLVTNGGGSATLVDASTATAHLQSQLAIVGSWLFDTPAGLVTLVFFSDGTYMIAEDGVADADGGPGIEHGTYTWDPGTGAFAASPSVDTSGRWGLSHSGGPVFVSVNGSTLDYFASTEGLDGTHYYLSRMSSDAGNALVGTWKMGSGSINDLVIVTFLSDGRYIMGEDGVVSTCGHDGMESGTYTWNSGTGDFSTSSISCDTNGCWGFSDHAGTTTATVTGDDLDLYVTGEGHYYLTRIAP